ncbi:DUF2303 family protein [Rhodococcus rhodochrous]|uniref:DUF2303 family protein n=1 Tax=Rhodococcus rhodochrous TaxID=1829 RepID=UPI00177DE16E|nr:DUF2303 family protein [Rhodococcus rhodochrous]QOH59821.1 hypothetical protein C6Y44_27395 [Rhodococcus rhodochrous]
MSTVQNNTEDHVSAIAELALDTTERFVPLSPAPGVVHTAVVRDGSGSERVATTTLEKHLPTPARPRGNTTVSTVESFLALLARTVTKHGILDEDVTVFGDVNAQALVAVLNHDGWGDHRITLKLVFSDLFAHWHGLDNKLVDQTRFAEHLSDGRAAIVTPAAADLMEIARTFKAKRNVTYESGVHLQSGDVSFTFHEETKAGAGAKGNVEIPERFELILPVFQGGQMIPFFADLKYRADQGGLSLGYRIDNPRQMVRLAFEQVLEEVKAGSNDAGYLLLLGSAPAPTDPWN